MREVLGFFTGGGEEEENGAVEVNDTSYLEVEAG